MADVIKHFLTPFFEPPSFSALPHAVKYNSGVIPTQVGQIRPPLEAANGISGDCLKAGGEPEGVRAWRTVLESPGIADRTAKGSKLTSRTRLC